MSYKLLEFGGKANAILRANIEMTINNVTYQPGDVVFLFDDINLNFTYNEKNVDNRSGTKNLMEYFERSINTINISNLSLTSNYIEIFGSFASETFKRSVVEKTTIQDNKWFSINSVDDSEIHIIDIGNRNVTFNAEYNEVVIDGDAIEDGVYTVVYKTKIEAPIYDINRMSSIPYMSMEIVGVGNVDKEDGNVYIYIPKVSLINRPDFSLTDKITAQDLTFKVIEDSIMFGVY